MNIYLDDKYGADADGNRGTPTWFYELQPDDDELVLDQLKIIYDEFDPVVESIPEEVDIGIINPYTEEDVLLTINTEPYLDKLRVYKIINNENYEAVIDSLVKFDHQTATKALAYLTQVLSKH